MEHRMRFLDWFFLASLSVLWGGSFFFAEIALREVSALVVVWARVGLAGLILFVLVRLKGLVIPRSRTLWFSFMVMGLLNNVIPFSLIVWAQTSITGSLASIFNATTPLFTIILAHYLTRDEKITWRKILGVILGFIGVVIMMGVQAMNGLGSSLLAQGAVLLAAVSYGLAALWGRRFASMAPLVVAMGQVVCAGLIMSVPAFMFGFVQNVGVLSLSTVLALFGLALFCTVIAYVLYFKILATSGASNLMLVTFLIPLSAIALGSLLIGERLELDHVIGMLFILMGLLIIDGRLFLRLKIIRGF